MIDIAQQISAISRQVATADGGDGEKVTVTLQRHYPSEPADVWEALTIPERVRRWFLPLTGDLREGGQFQLEGNASGDILSCAPPERLVVTFGDPSSLVEVRLVEQGGGTLLSLEHSVPLAVAGSGAGALYVGPGWDGALMGLALHLDGVVTDDPVAAANTLEAQQFCARSIEEWVGMIKESGTADADAIAAARAVSMAQFAPALA
jgi:uncharacterized protein YndB with AHSA1/START domain